MTTVALNQFDGGMTNDPRDPHVNMARIIEHLDNYSLPHLLTPYPDQDFNAATDPNSAANFDSFRLTQFGYANSLFWALGVAAGTARPKLFQKTLIGDAWAASTSGDDASGGAARYTDIFTLYQNNWYLAEDSKNWATYGDITGSPTYTKAVKNLSGSIAHVPPVVHSKDDIMYSVTANSLGNGKWITTNNAGVWNETALAFPIDHDVVTLEEYGNYLAIGANRTNDTCLMYLWDRDLTLSTLSDKIDIGSGKLKWIRNLNGTLVACLVMEPSDALSINTTIVFKYYNGTEFVTFQEFTASAAMLSNLTQKYNNLIYFIAEMTLDSIPLRGVWKVVKMGSGALSVSFDRQPRLDDTVVSGTLYGFLRTGDYFHVATQNIQDSNKYVVTKTIPTGTSTTAIYRTAINPGMPNIDRLRLKKLRAVSVSFEPLGASEGVTLKYRVDGGAWATIFTETTDGEISREATFEANDDAFTDGVEFEFSIEPGAGAKVSELKYRYDPLTTAL